MSINYVLRRLEQEAAKKTKTEMPRKVKEYKFFLCALESVHKECGEEIDWEYEAQACFL